MDPIIGGALVGAGSNLLGGLLGRRSSDRAAAQNLKQQREFAQKGIRWRVADAKAAGLHPLYALGAQTHSFQPITVQDSLGPALSAAGQDISRAMYQSASAGDRAAAKVQAALQTENMGLQNDLLRAQIAKLQGGQVSPPIPNVGVYDAKPPEVLNSRPGASHITAGPAGPAYTEADFGPFKLNLFSQPVSEQLEDMELLKYWLMYKGNEGQIDDYVSRQAEPLFEYIYGKQRAVEEAAEALRNWAGSVRQKYLNKRAFAERRARPQKYWGREVR